MRASHKNMVVVVATVLHGCQFMPGTAAYKEEKAKNIAAQLLIDPSSALFRAVRTGDGAVCGEINGKNRMGAYVGFTRFYVSTGNWGAFLEPDAGDGAESLTGDTFASLWTSSCESDESELKVRNAGGFAFDGSRPEPKTNENLLSTEMEDMGDVNVAVPDWELDSSTSDYERVESVMESSSNYVEPVYPTESLNGLLDGLGE